MVASSGITTLGAGSFPPTRIVYSTLPALEDVAFFVL